MKILGIQKNHHSSVALFENENLLYFNEEERLLKIKKDYRFPFLCLKEIKKKFNKVDLVLLTGYTNEGNNYIFQYLKNELNLITQKNELYYYHNSHHLIHAAKAFFDSPFKNALIFVLDGRGSTYNLSNGEIGYETTSVYEVNEDKNFKCLFKKIYTNSEVDDKIKVNFTTETFIFYKIKTLSIDSGTQVEISNDNDIGPFYGLACKNYGWHNEEGKLMGLSAYGKEITNIDKICNSSDLFVKNLGDSNSNNYFNFNKYSDIKITQENQQNLKNLSYAIQKKFENDYFNLINKFLEKKKYNNIILTGGTGLNVVNNFKIKQKLPQYNLFVDPLCSDVGLSIGICKYYLNINHPEINLKKLNNLYLGPKYEYDLKLKNNEILFDDIDVLKIVELLIQGNIVALYQGGCEAGPRALGNRSLLLDPRIKNGKEIMNSVKQREFFRPFACSILKEKFKEWFDTVGLDESPFMMYAFQALKGVKEKINSVIHVDNTCRVQTVSKKDNIFFYDLLQTFYKITNIPILMNTSFNLAGETIVETPEDALDTLRRSKIEYLYFSDIKKLIFIKNK